MKRKLKPMDRYQVSFAQEAFVDLFADGVGYLRAEEAEMEQPSLFDLIGQEVQ